MPYSALSHLDCPRCGTRYDADRVQGTCTCGSPLLAVRAFRAGARQSEPWQNPKTVAFGLTVPKPLGDFLILDALYATSGTAVSVTDEALLAEQRAVARLEGNLICPEGAACFAAVRQLRASGWLSAADEVVVLNTGTGLIYPETMPAPAR